MELKIFKKKNVSFLEILEFLIKFIFYIDTSELFLKDKKEPNLFKKNKSKTLSLFDYCFYSNSEIYKILNVMNYQSGGSVSESSSISGETNALSISKLKSVEPNEPVENSGNIGANNGNSGANSGNSGSTGENTKKNDEESQRGIMQFIEEIKEYFMKGVKFINEKVMAIISLIVYASIYPAIPFFLVMASLYGSLKYLMYKFRNF